jgi:hypothetical protein
MTEHSVEAQQRALEERSRALFQESVDGLDMATRSRLTQARHAALAAGAATGRRAWILRLPFLTPAAGVTVAAALAFALWFATPLGNHHSGMSADAQSNFEDLDLVASSDEGSGDAMEMLQDDIEFYNWAEKVASSGPSA